MKTPAHDWREELKQEVVGMLHPEIYRRTCSFIENLLDQHTAHLVERIENMAIVDDYGEERKIGFQIAKDQAIDIVKDNK